jgi:Glycosyl hydrolase family 71
MLKLIVGGAVWLSILTGASLGRIALLTLCLSAAGSAAPGANAGDDNVPWQEIDTLATRFVAQESPSGVFPFADPPGAKSAFRKVYLNYFPWLLLSLDNKPLNADFWSTPGKTIPAVPAPSDNPGAFFNTTPITLNQRPISPQPWDSPFWRERNLAIDIRRAQRIGADGFLLTLPQINQGPMWDAAVMLCRVATHVAPGFRVIIQPGMASLVGGKVQPEALVDAIATLGACPAADHLADGQLVIGPWAAELEPPEFWRAVMSGLAAKGVKTALLPVLLSASDDSAGRLAPLSYEMSYWAWSDVNSTAGPQARHVRDLLSSPFGRWMAPVRPQDVRPKQSISGESENTAMFRQMWMAAIQDPKAADVQIITWNALSEGTEIEPASATQFLFYDLSAYYTFWYKRGHPPAIRSDAIYYCSRTQDLAGAATGGHPADRYHGIPVASAVGPMKVLGQTPLASNIEMVAFLTAPSRLEIAVAGRTFQKDAGPGLAVLTVPAVASRPLFRIVRAGAVVAQVEAHYAIAPAGAVPNLFYYGGSSNRPVVEMPINPRLH